MCIKSFLAIVWAQITMMCMYTLLNTNSKLHSHATS